MPAPTSTCHGVRRPEYRPVPGLGGSAGDRSDDQCPDPIGPGEHAAPFGWPDANQGVAFERKVLARFKLEHAAALERDVHLLLAVLRVVVPGMAGGIRRGDSIVCTPKLVSPSWARTFRIDPRKGGLHLIEALARRACYRVLPLIVLWWCRFAAPAGRLGPGWCNLNKGCSGVCSPPTWWPCSSARRSARLRPRRSTYYAHPSKPLLGAPGCGRAYESCRFVK